MDYEPTITTKIEPIDEQEPPEPLAGAERPYYTPPQ